MSQTSYRTEERVGRHGAAMETSPAGSVSRYAAVAMRPGDLALKPTAFGGEDKAVRKPTAPAAADADAIIEQLGSTAGDQTISGASLDGTIGAGRIFPPRNLTITLNSHTDWDVTTAIVTGKDEFGREITEDFAIPDGGNTVLTGSKVFSQVTSLFLPAQTGTNGLLDLGTGTKLGPLTSLDVDGVVRYLARQQVASAAAEFEAGDVLNIIHEGLVALEVEADVKGGEQLYVRLVATGAEVVGAYRNDRDGTAAAPDAVPVIGMRFASDSIDRDGVKIAPVRLDLPNI